MNESYEKFYKPSDSDGESLDALSLRPRSSNVQPNGASQLPPPCTTSVFKSEEYTDDCEYHEDTGDGNAVSATQKSADETDDYADYDDDFEEQTHSPSKAESQLQYASSYFSGSAPATSTPPVASPVMSLKTVGSANDMAHLTKVEQIMQRWYTGDPVFMAMPADELGAKDLRSSMSIDRSNDAKVGISAFSVDIVLMMAVGRRGLPSMTGLTKLNLMVAMASLLSFLNCLTSKV